MAILPAIYLGINAGMRHQTISWWLCSVQLPHPGKNFCKMKRCRCQERVGGKYRVWCHDSRGHGIDMLGLEMAHIHCHNFCCCFSCFTLVWFLLVVVCLLFGFGFVAVVVLLCCLLLVWRIYIYIYIVFAYLSLSHPVARRAIRIPWVWYNQVNNPRDNTIFRLATSLTMFD